MKLHNNQNEITKNTDGGSNFKIKTSAKAFKILSDKLYSDKYAAVIREYSTNAYDAHVDAGCADMPFEVHLPTYDETYFYVRDFGLGMDETQVTTLFTTYFESDKEDSNEFVGALGLGSKSAFAYTDSFTVESFNNGMYKMYNCYISETGFPVIDKMAEKETDESGLKIRFNVKRDDINEFSKRAKSIYRFFKTLPTFVGSEMTIPQETTSFTGNGWTISKIGRWDDYSGAYAVQGNIAYPISSSNLTGLSSKHKFILDNNFRIDFTLGDLDIAPSREHLSYDELTINNIKAKCEQVFDEVYDMIALEVRAEKTPWLATKKFKEVTDSMSLNSARDYIAIVYDGKPLEFTYSVNVKSDVFKEVDFIKFSMYRSRIKRSVMGKDYQKNYDFTPGGKTIFVIQNEEGERIPQNKARSLVNYDHDVVFVSGKAKEFIEVMGGVDVRYTSTIEKVKPKKSAKVQKTMGKPFIPMNENGFFDADKALSIKDIGSHIYFIPVNRFKPVDGENKMENTTFARLVKNARALGVLKATDTIYGVLGWGVKQYVKGNQFTNALVHIRGNLDATFEKKVKDVKSYRRASQAIDLFNRSVVNKNIVQAFNNGWITPTGPAVEIFEKYNKLNKRVMRYQKSDKFKVINQMISDRGFNIEVQADKIDNIGDHYPMLKFAKEMFTDWHYDLDRVDAKEMGKYMAMVDGVEV